MQSLRSIVIVEAPTSSPFFSYLFSLIFVSSVDFDLESKIKILSI